MLETIAVGLGLGGQQTVVPAILEEKGTGVRQGHLGQLVMGIDGQLRPQPLRRDNDRRDSRRALDGNDIAELVGNRGQLFVGIVAEGKELGARFQVIVLFF